MSYENYDLWFETRLWREFDDGKHPGNTMQPMEFRKLTAHFGSDEFDMQKFMDSEHGRIFIQKLADGISFPDRRSEAVNKWAHQFGLNRTVMDGESDDTLWTFYSPMDMDASKKYPVVIVIYGGGIPGDWEVGSSWIPKAGKEKFCLMMFGMNFVDIPSIFDKLERVKQEYPIDAERVYASGYSHGGFKATYLTTMHPELFAGVCPSGNSAFSGLDAVKPRPYAISEERVENLKNYPLPTVTICGEEESINLLPINVFRQCSEAPGINASIEDRIHALQIRIEAIGGTAPTVEAIMAAADSEDEVERQIGAPADETEIRELLGVRHFIARYKGYQGLPLLTMIGVENHPHFAPATLADLAWEVFSHYARNQETGELIYS